MKQATGQTVMNVRAAAADLLKRGEAEAEAEVLAKIQALKTSGETLAAIAEALDAQGIRPRRGELWHPYAVARIAER
jgi:hypothetical protein